MDAKLQLKCTLPSSPYLAVRKRFKASRVVGLRVNAVLTRPANEHLNGIRNANTDIVVYKDSWFDRLAIRHLSKSVQDTTDKFGRCFSQKNSSRLSERGSHREGSHEDCNGHFNAMEGYDSLVEAARVVLKNFSPVQQRELVIEALYKAFPKPILSLIRMMLPDSKLKREYFAAFTTLFFTWLIGPCEVRASDHNGRTEKNVVHIQKCRFLQESNCVGMCTNLCKFPSQAFIKDSFGMSVNMVPNFDDMSCQMIFGQEPPLPDQDPALKQPCYKLCKIKQRHDTECTSG